MVFFLAFPWYSYDKSFNTWCQHCKSIWKIKLQWTNVQVNISTSNARCSSQYQASTSTGYLMPGSHHELVGLSWCHFSSHTLFVVVDRLPLGCSNSGLYPPWLMNPLYMSQCRHNVSDGLGVSCVFLTHIWADFLAVWVTAAAEVGRALIESSPMALCAGRWRFPLGLHYYTWTESWWEDSGPLIRIHS